MIQKVWLCAVSLISASTLLFLSACGSSSNPRLRVVNATSSVGGIDVVVDSTTVATNIGYAADTGYLPTSAGSRHVRIEPTGTSSPFFDSTLSINSDTTIIATGPGTAGMVLTDDNSKPSSGNFKLRVVNVEPTLGAFDIYIVAPGTDINTVSPTISGLNPQSSSAYEDMAAATEEILVTPAGSKFVYVDTGSTSFSAGQIRTLVILDNNAGGVTTSVLSDLN